MFYFKFNINKKPILDYMIQIFSGIDRLIVNSK